jgi:hypothetical protein
LLGYFISFIKKDRKTKVKSIAIISVLLLLGLNGFGQEEKENTLAAGDFALRHTFFDDNGNKIYSKVNTYREASFVGGQKALAEYYNNAVNKEGIDSENLPHYVNLEIVIDKWGEVKSVIPFIKGNKELDNIFVKTFMDSPIWNPAIINGNKVGQKIILKIPITFKLK